MIPLFKRDDKTTIAELEEYYANQKKARRSKAWMMGLLSFVITVGVITSLFFAGRWGYQELTKDDGTDNVATTQGADDAQTEQSETQGEITGEGSGSEQVELPTFDSNNSDEQGVEFGGSTSNNPEDLIVIEPTEEEGVVSDEAATITVEPDTATDQSDDTSDVAAINDQRDANNSGTVAGEQTNEIPNTGTNEIVLIFVATTVAGYTFSRSRQLSKN